MKKMIRIISVACALCLGLLTACGSQAVSSSAAGGSAASGSAASTDAAAQTDKVEVVCATFPAYDWTMQVIGDNADACNVTYLMGNGVDLHSFEPTVEDIAKISSADLFVYVGGESDGWAQDAVTAAANPNLHTVNMLEAVGDAAVEEEVVEGMQAGEEEHADAEEAGGEEGHHHDASDAPEYDEHVWLSLKNAQVLVDAIAAELSEVDADHADAYAANASAYNAQLVDLDKRYDDAIKAASKDTVVFADRFPFRYLVDDYGLNYYAAFVGCSAETEASFETIAFLAEKVDELGLSSVIVIEGSDQRIAQTVIQSTKDKNQQILVMDSLQSASDADVASGKNYLSVMEENLSCLKTALA